MILPILGFPNYAITDDGRIWSSIKNRWRKPTPTAAGYPMLPLIADGRIHMRYVHRLMWETYCGKIPDGLEINHKNGKPSDNRLENLEVVTPSQNMLHSYRVLGRKHNTEPAWRSRSKLTDESATEIRRLYAAGDTTYRKLAKQFNVSYWLIEELIQGKKWKHLLEIGK